VGDPANDTAFSARGKEHALRFTIKALRRAHQQLYPRKLRDVVVDLDLDSLCILVACGLLHEQRVTPDHVEAWLEEEPSLYSELGRAVLIAVNRAYVRLQPKEEPAAAPGEESAPDGA